MNGMRITKNTVDNLYELFDSEKSYSCYLKLDLDSEDTKQADDVIIRKVKN